MVKASLDNPILALMDVNPMIMTIALTEYLLPVRGLFLPILLLPLHNSLEVRKVIKVTSATDTLMYRMIMTLLLSLELDLEG